MMQEMSISLSTIVLNSRDWYEIIIIIIIITSNDDIQPSTVVSNQLPSGLVLVILIIHGPVNFLNTQ